MKIGADVINIELDKIFKWMCLNKLSMNLEKTKFMIFSFKKQNFEFDLKINGNRLEKVTKFDHLGIVLHENLKWEAHVDKITSKIRRTLAVMRKNCKITPQNILKMIYMSLIHSQFNYGILVWGF